MDKHVVGAFQTHSEVADGPAAIRADPANVLRRAWSEFRLMKLQQLVMETITSLANVDPVNLLGRTLDESDTSAPGDPIAVALEACCAELREECGMVDSCAERATHGEVVRGHMEDHPMWGAKFREAFRKYRELAGRLLDSACHQASADAGRATPPSCDGTPPVAPVAGG